MELNLPSSVSSSRSSVSSNNELSPLKLSSTNTRLLSPNNSIVKRLEIEGGAGDPALTEMRTQARDNLNAVMSKVVKGLAGDTRSVGDKIDAMYDIVVKDGFVVKTFNDTDPNNSLLIHNLAKKHLDCDTYASLVVGAAEILGWRDVNVVTLSDHAFIRWQGRNFDEGEILPDKYYSDRWGESIKRAEASGDVGISVSAWTGRGLASERLGNSADAIASYSRSIDILPTPSALNNRGNIYRRQGDTQRATQDLLKAIELDPKYAAPHNGLGLIYKRQGDVPKAIEEFSAAIAINPQYSDAYFNRGNLYIQQTNIPGAISDFSRVIDMNPSDTDAYFKRGYLHATQGNNEMGIADLSKAIEIRPDYSAAYRVRSELYRRQGNAEKAKEDVSRSQP